MTTQHTPAPWHIGPITSQGHNVQIRAVNQESPEFEVSVAILGGWGTSKEENEANARLIAAAPELLEALIEAGKYLQGDVGCAYPQELFEVIQAAIAKATGE